MADENIWIRIARRVSGAALRVGDDQQALTFPIFRWMTRVPLDP
jgi:hypothetical protein